MEKTLFYLQERLSIGRAADNDIVIEDPNVAPHHATVYRENDTVIVEDLGSTSGTCLNGECFQKAVLTNGDRLQVADTVCQFIQELIDEPVDDKLKGSGAKASSITGFSHAIKGSATARPSKRLMEVIPSLSLFEGVTREGLKEIIENVRLLIYEPEQMILNQGDVGKSLFIILDGKVKVFWLDPGENRVLLAMLGEGDVFGEMSFFTGAPRTASIQAVDNTLLCKINFEEMRWVVYRWPAIKQTLLRCYRERLALTEAKKRADGYVEHREYPRANLTLPLSFTVTGDSDGEKPFNGKVFRTLTKNISASGLLIRVQDAALHDIETNHNK